MAAVCLQVCVLCGEEAGGATAGQRLLEALQTASAEMSEIDVAPVECFAVCDRAVTLAFRAAEGSGRWSYLIGGTEPDSDTADILAAAQAVADSPQGVPAMEDRPRFFRDGVIARIPPGTSDASAVRRG